MQELEKILEEIDREVEEYMEIDFGDEYNAGIKDMAKMAKKIIRKHINAGWIPVSRAHAGKLSARRWTSCTAKRASAGFTKSNRM